MSKNIHTAVIANPTEFRKNISAKISNLYEKGNSSNSTVGINIEKSVYNYAIQEAKRRKIIKKWENPLFLQIYLDRLRSIFANLHELLPHILSNEIHPSQLCSMTHQEMNPLRWHQLIDQKMKRDASKYTTNIEASTDMFTCRKCRSKKCTYYELQTRSADEPASIFVTCLDCGKHWKQC
jgi:transcription elongation factor S-II